MSTGGKGGGGGVKLRSKDVNQILQTQNKYDLDSAYRQAQLNAVNQTTPFGSISYTGQGDYNGLPTSYSVNTTLSPEQQQLYNQNVGLQGQALSTAQGALPGAAANLGSAFDLSGLGAVPGLGPQGRNELTDAIMQRMAPDIEADRARTETRLANQGIALGSEAYDTANRQLERNINDQRTSAYITGAGAEQDRALQARNQAINEQLQQRQVPLGDLSSIMGLAGLYTGQYPQQVNTPQTGINSVNANGAYGMLAGPNNTGSAGNILGPLLGAGGTAAGLYFGGGNPLGGAAGGNAGFQLGNMLSGWL